MSKERDLCRMYDTFEAYGILREQMLVGSYEFSEELPFADPVFSFQGRQKLPKRMCYLGRNDFVAIFTSDPFILTIGGQDSHPFIIDTHKGKGNGLLMIGKQNLSQVWKSFCVWLWQC